MNNSRHSRKNLGIKCEIADDVSRRFKVMVYDSNNNIIYNSIQMSNKTETIEIPDCDEYKIKVEAPDGYTPAKAFRWIKARPCCNRLEFFEFTRLKRPPKVVNKIITLCDCNYCSLPITEGEILMVQQLKIWKLELMM